MSFDVAPFVGAWIEICWMSGRQARTVSLPSWERGLKSAVQVLGYQPHPVAPFVGAWIEIADTGGTGITRGESLPSWERGLKYRFKGSGLNETWSLPSWERGLKFIVFSFSEVVDRVAPFVGAWIEILQNFRSCPTCLVAPFVGAWIEILQNFRSCPTCLVAPFVGAWIEI